MALEPPTEMRHLQSRYGRGEPVNNPRYCPRAEVPVEVVFVKKQQTWVVPREKSRPLLDRGFFIFLRGEYDGQVEVLYFNANLLSE